MLFSKASFFFFLQEHGQPEITMIIRLCLSWVSQFFEKMQLMYEI